MRAPLLFLCSTTLSLTVVASSAFQNGTLPRRGCGTTFSTSQVAHAEAEFRALLESNPPSNLDAVLPPIQVIWHVVYAAPVLEKAYIPPEEVTRSIEQLNKDYADTGFSFELMDLPRYVRNASWFGIPPGFLETEMKDILREGDEKVLNVYSAGLDGNYLGWGSYPISYEEFPKYDGVVVHYGSVPGGNYEFYNQGRTLTHEVGHWLGIYHVFESGCDEPGDRVADTPPQYEATNGCPKVAPQSCSPGVYDSIHNFMDYSIDGCMSEFKPGQIQRAKQQVSLFRGIG